MMGVAMTRQNAYIVVDRSMGVEVVQVTLRGWVKMMRALDAEPGILRTATRYALNDSADDVLERVQSNMRARFDRPTRFALNAFMVKYARKSDKDMTATVTERPSVGKRHFLKVQEAGGARGQTGIEKMLGYTLPLPGIFNAVTPTQHAKRDAAGNWSPGERNKAISAIKGWRETGYSANETAASRSRKKSKRTTEYFIPPTKSDLPPGIYKAEHDGALKIANFTRFMPKYKPLLGFYDGAQEVFDEAFPRHLDRAVGKLRAKEAAAAAAKAARSAERAAAREAAKAAKAAAQGGDGA